MILHRNQTSMSTFDEVSSNGGKHIQDLYPKQSKGNDSNNEVYNKPSYRIEQKHQQTEVRSDRKQKFQYDNRNKNNNRDRYNPPRYRDGRSPSRNNNDNGYSRKVSKPRINEKNSSKVNSTFTTSGGTVTDGATAKVVTKKSEEVCIHTNDHALVDSINDKLTTLHAPKTTNASNESNKPESKFMPAHGHYRHKNSNKPRFAKVFTENSKDKDKSSAVVKTSEISEELQSIHSEIAKDNSKTQASNDRVQGI